MYTQVTCYHRFRNFHMAKLVVSFRNNKGKTLAWKIFVVVLKAQKFIPHINYIAYKMEARCTKLEFKINLHVCIRGYHEIPSNSCSDLGCQIVV